MRVNIKQKNTMLKFTKEVENFIQKWSVIHHEKGEFYHIPYYFKKIKPSDPRKKKDTVWEIISLEHLPKEIKEMIREAEPEILKALKDLVWFVENSGPGERPGFTLEQAKKAIKSHIK